MIEILHICPANCATGGPEAIHEFVSELNEIEGVRARIWYWDIKKPDPCPEEYKGYNCEYVTELPEGYSGVLIYPEIWASHALDYPECFNAVYWLGVDAYASWTDDPGAFLQDDKILHIVQSEYALDFLRRLGVKWIIKRTDTVNEDFYRANGKLERSDIVLYNPAKATPFLHEVMRSCDAVFKPIQSMTRQEVIQTMRSSKLYIDFGEFPGRERIPREAVLCGCCIITSKIGSADYYEDFPHDYKFDSKSAHIWAIRRKIEQVLNNYEECRKDFRWFRQELMRDKIRVKAQSREVIRAIQHYYTGV